MISKKYKLQLSGSELNTILAALSQSYTREVQSMTKSSKHWHDKANYANGLHGI